MNSDCVVRAPADGVGIRQGPVFGSVAIGVVKVQVAAIRCGMVEVGGVIAGRIDGIQIKVRTIRVPSQGDQNSGLIEIGNDLERLLLRVQRDPVLALAIRSDGDKRQGVRSGIQTQLHTESSGCRVDRCFNGGGPVQVDSQFVDQNLSRINRPRQRDRSRGDLLSIGVRCDIDLGGAIAIEAIHRIHID